MALTAPNDLTWDITPPRRPSLQDCGEALHENDTAYPPTGPIEPYAEELNQWAKQISRMGGVVPAAILYVTFAGGNPGVTQFVAMPTGVTLSTFTLTDNGPGDTSITWPAGTFPTSVMWPSATIADDTAHIICALRISNGVRVKTRNLAGGSEDSDFVAMVF